VYTDQGLFGQGESTDAAMGSVPLMRSFSRLLVGQDPLNVEAAFERIRTSGVFAGAQSGQYVTALTGIEIALWDLAGKALGVPVYQLLGGKVRDRVRVYCDSGSREMIPGDEHSKARIHQIQELGFTAAKIDIDDATDPARFDHVNWTASNGEIDHMVAKVAFTRELYPKNFDLAVDMHARYDVGTGKRVAKELEPFKLMFLEEPVPAENIDAMRDVRESTSTPICCGENVYLRWGFRELFEKQAVDIIMPDIQKCGGLAVISRRPGHGLDRCCAGGKCAGAAASHYWTRNRHRPGDRPRGRASPPRHPRRQGSRSRTEGSPRRPPP
jgi:galactonate dehydratase